MNNLNEALLTALKMEKKGYEEYIKAADRCEDDTLAAILLSLANDEEEHERVIGSFYHAMVESKGWPVVDTSLLPIPEAAERIELIMNETAAKITDGTTFIGIYEVAHDLETRSREFYLNEMGKATDREVIEMFRFLARIEGIHMDMLNLLLQATRGEA
ncbi:ferritin family protein [uncultured Desulfobulbus sp.]|uniref:ferritin family protein n=1 Tax=uncultured Desulfobulbus sp. TaxID=239745 RepID=UPI0029C6C62F|nr:ferritin family protein [uncultured Desulfobulbus sp.]